MVMIVAVTATTMLFRTNWNLAVHLITKKAMKEQSGWHFNKQTVYIDYEITYLV